jgi:hypothetical protein
MSAGTDKRGWLRQVKSETGALTCTPAGRTERTEPPALEPLVDFGDVRGLPPCAHRPGSRLDRDARGLSAGGLLSVEDDRIERCSRPSDASRSARARGQGRIIGAPRDHRGRRAGHYADMDFRVDIDPSLPVTLNGETFVLERNGLRRTLRIQDYDDVYAVPNLYEHVVQERLGCTSPQTLAA